MCDDKEMWSHYLVLVQKKIVKLVLLTCNQNWHLTDYLSLLSPGVYVCVLCRCVPVLLCICALFFLLHCDCGHSSLYCKIEAIKGTIR